jgi:hypothetical protein
VLALDRLGPFLSTPNFLRAVVSHAEKVHLEKGGTVMLNLKITPWPQ